VLTSIGSANLGYRSVFRDLEMQLFVATENTALQTRLQAEVAGMLDSCTTVDESVRRPRLPWGQRAAARLASHWCRGFF